MDVLAFEHLCRDGAELMRAGEPALASQRLEAALSLWRGAPLADIPSRSLTQAEVPRLERLRLQAIELRVGASLALGGHSEVIPEIEGLAAAHPLREHLIVKLMLAMYRCGRQGEALAIYRQTRQLLATELGVEPGPELREMHQMILTADPGLDWRPPDAGRAVLGQVAAGPGPDRSGLAAVTEAPPAAAESSAAVARSTAAVAGDTASDGEDMPDAAGERPQADESPAIQVTPQQLPLGPSHFTGRKQELTVLAGLLGSAARAAGTAAGGTGGAMVLCVIDGMAGVGKTALAVHCARQAATVFPDGQLYVNLRGFDPSGTPMTSAEAIRGFLTAFQVAAELIPATLDAQAGLYRSLLAGQRVLVVLDNARDADQVRPLLPGSATCAVVVTSRNRLTSLVAHENARTLTLDLLTDAEAGELLTRRLGPERAWAESAAVAELTRLCGRLPLALAIAVARAGDRPGVPLASLATELRDAAGRLEALDVGDATASVRAAFSWSYRQLSPAAARMLRLLGLHPGPDVTIPAAASLAGLPAAETRKVVATLGRAHLVTELTSGRYALHDLLRAYAAEQAAATDSDADRHAAVQRMLDHYLHTAHAAALLLNPSREPVTLAAAWPGVTPEPLAGLHDARTWFEAEHQVLLAAVGLAAETGFDVPAWQLPWAMTTFLDGHGHWQEQADLQRTALQAAARLGDVAGQSVTRHALATACAMLGDCDQARTHLTDGLSLCRQLGDRAGEARAHLIFGFVEQRQERYSCALSHAQQALFLFQAIGDRGGETAALNGVGWCHSLLGNHERARAICQQALAIYVEIGNRYGEAYTWDSLGYAEHHLGLHADAITSYTRAIDLHAELGNRVNEATSLIHLGDTQRAVGNYGAARVTWNRGLAILSDLRHPDADGVRAKLEDISA